MVAGYGNSFGGRRDIYDETGIYARWYFEERLNEECSRAHRKGQRIVLFCVAVDGRSALTAWYTLWRNVRDFDLIGRIARTRFVVAALDAAPADSDNIADRLLNLIGAQSEVAVAVFPEDGEDAKTLITTVTTRVLGAKAS